MAPPPRRCCRPSGNCALGCPGGWASHQAVSAPWAAGTWFAVVHVRTAEALTRGALSPEAPDACKRSRDLPQLRSVPRTCEAAGRLAWCPHGGGFRMPWHPCTGRPCPGCAWPGHTTPRTRASGASTTRRAKGTSPRAARPPRLDQQPKLSPPRRCGSPARAGRARAAEVVGARCTRGPVAPRGCSREVAHVACPPDLFPVGLELATGRGATGEACEGGRSEEPARRWNSWARVPPLPPLYVPSHPHGGWVYVRFFGHFLAGPGRGAVDGRHARPTARRWPEASVEGRRPLGAAAAAARRPAPEQLDVEHARAAVTCVQPVGSGGGGLRCTRSS